MAKITKEITRKDDFLDSNLECITINLTCKNEEEFYSIINQLNHDDLEVAGCPTVEDNYYWDQIAFFKKSNGYTWKEIEEESNDFYRYAKAFIQSYNNQ